MHAWPLFSPNYYHYFQTFSPHTQIALLIISSHHTIISQQLTFIITPHPSFKFPLLVHTSNNVKLSIRRDIRRYENEYGSRQNYCTWYVVGKRRRRRRRQESMKKGHCPHVLINPQVVWGISEFEWISYLHTLVHWIPQSFKLSGGFPHLQYSSTVLDNPSTIYNISSYCFTWCVKWERRKGEACTERVSNWSKGFE